VGGEFRIAALLNDPTIPHDDDSINIGEVLLPMGNQNPRLLATVIKKTVLQDFLPYMRVNSR
jgi:hypothetical protein